jgi:hypothetical protein
LGYSRMAWEETGQTFQVAAGCGLHLYIPD